MHSRERGNLPLRMRLLMSVKERVETARRRLSTRLPLIQLSAAGGRGGRGSFQGFAKQ
jgi:hypothetical protein